MLLAGCAGEISRPEQTGYIDAAGDAENENYITDEPAASHEVTAQSPEGAAQTSETAAQAPVEVDERIGELISVDGADYKIETRRYFVSDDINENYIDIVYPQIAEMDDADIQEQINILLGDNAFGLLRGHGEGVTGLEINATYDITLSGANFLSMKFNIYFYREGAAYCSDLLQTANIDMRTGENLKLSDFFIIDDSFVEKFKTCAILDSEKYHIFPETFEIILRNNTDEEFKEWLSIADIPLNVYMQTDFASYFTKETLVISFGTSKAMMSYAEIVLSYDDLKENMRTDNDLWCEISPSLAVGQK